VNKIPEIRPEQSLELLKELHILTRDGKLNQDSRRKLKQVYHLYQFIEPLLAEVMAQRGDLTLVDHGAGKSYLGFILYDLFLKRASRGRCSASRRAPSWWQSPRTGAAPGLCANVLLNLSVAESIASPQLPQQADIVTALHACDTATDDAIRFALAKQARFIVLVPCCQAEVAAVLRRHKADSLAKTPLAEIWRHPIHTREFGSQITNVLRCLLLEAHGYRLTVTELVGWEHSMKNELIIARRGDAPRGNARERLGRILDELNLDDLRGRFDY
jgi:hypothetical protein